MAFLLLVIVFFPLILLLLLRQVINRQTPPTALRLPPGPRELPVISNLHNVVGPLPHRTFTSLASVYGPIMRLKLGEVPVIIISSREAAKEILGTQDIAFASRPHLLANEILTNNKDFILAPYGEYWRQIRKISVVDLLSSKKVDSFRWIREDEMWSLVRTIVSAEGGLVDLHKLLSSMSNNVIMRAMMGDKCKDQSRFLHLVEEFVNLGSGLQLADFYPSSKFVRWVTRMTPKLMNQAKLMDEVLSSILAQHEEKRKSSGGEAKHMLDVLLKLKDKGDLAIPLTDKMLHVILVDLLSAGSETTTTILVWIMSELMNHREVMRKAQEEVRDAFKGHAQLLSESGISKLEYLELVIKETLRLHPPLPLLLPHQSRMDCKVMGYDIPNNTKIIVNYWALGRDKNYWEDPDSFIPERFKESPKDYNGTDFDFIPFGAGRRMCPGMSFGLVVVRSALTHLLYYFDWKLPAGSTDGDLDMTESFGVTAARKSQLCLCATTYCTISKS